MTFRKDKKVEELSPEISKIMKFKEIQKEIQDLELHIKALNQKKLDLFDEKTRLMKDLLEDEPEPAPKPDRSNEAEKVG